MNAEELWRLLTLRFRAHPWHGVSIGDRFPQSMTVYIEIVPTDTVKYEVDKPSGILKVDRPQRFSNVCPMPYGLIPRTYCGDKVADLMERRTGKRDLSGDGDPLDVCVLTEKALSHGDLLLEAVPIGGLSMLDGDEADDKIIAVMKGDAAFGNWQDISECPAAVIERLKHYFLTYKKAPGSEDNRCSITAVYGHDEAIEVIRASLTDYETKFSNMEARLKAALEE